MEHSVFTYYWGLNTTPELNVTGTFRLSDSSVKFRDENISMMSKNLNVRSLPDTEM